MTSGFEWTVEGFDDVIAKFAEGDELATRLLSGAMTQSVALVGNNAAGYPPESSANAPPPPYYQRGVGTIYADGSTRGESQQMNTKWNREVAISDDEIVGTVENTATYAPFVHGMVRQIPIHQSRDWRKVDKIALDTRDGVLQFFQIAAGQWASMMRGK